MNTKVIIKGSTLLKNLPQPAFFKVKDILTYENPKYKQAKKNGRWIGNDLKPYLYFYKEKGSSLIVPRGMVGKVCKLLKIPTSEIIDFTVAPPINISFKGVLRKYQEIAVKDMLGRRYGILQGATGSGKTVMGTAIAAERKVKTLVIVHNKELKNQWIQAFKEFTNVTDIGVIGDGDCDVKDVTIGIINSVHPKAEVLKNEFGLVIYDECHRAIGDTWIKTINTLRPKFHIGLSATPYRSDGLTNALFHIVGPIIHRVNRKYLENTGAVLVPRIVRIQTRFFYTFRNDYSTMLSTLTRDDTRNILLANTIIKEFQTYKEPIMVVSDRVSHCDVLAFLLKDIAGLKPVVIHGKLNKKIREQAVKDLKSGKHNVLVATVSLLGEGFDAPDLNAIFLTTPIKFSGRLIQIIGRILRPSKDGKQPRVYDFKDTLIQVLRWSGFARDRVYKEHGWV